MAPHDEVREYFYEKKHALHWERSPLRSRAPPLGLGTSKDERSSTWNISLAHEGVVDPTETGRRQYTNTYALQCHFALRIHFK